MITLFQYYRVWGLPNASPFCMKLETYLRMAKLPYDNKFVNDPRKAPKRKLPFIRIEGDVYTDSELIIDQLKILYGDEVDKDLSAEQKALALLVDVACTERLYWVLVYLRWQHDLGWIHLKETMFSKLPAIPKLFVPNLVRKGVFKQLEQQGMGRHSLDETIALGIKTIDALSVILGEKKYLLGDRPSSSDATLFAFFANILISPLDDPFKQYVNGVDNIKKYCNRMWDEYFPDLTKPQL